MLSQPVVGICCSDGERQLIFDALGLCRVTAVGVEYWKTVLENNSGVQGKNGLWHVPAAPKSLKKEMVAGGQLCFWE